MASLEDLICTLQKCRRDKNLWHAKRLYAEISNNGLEAHKAVGNYVVPMFVECGSMPHAQQIFNRLVYRNEHSWTSLILGYIQSDQSQHALNLYHKMQEDTVAPSRFTLMALLKACAKLKDVVAGQTVHVQIIDSGHEMDIVVGSSLVDMYAKCGALSQAREAFDKLPVRNVVSWTALISGYVDYGFGHEALNCFEQMQLEGVTPDAVTFVCLLKACGSIRAIEKGQEIHAKIIKAGFNTDLFVGSSLVDMYAKCSLLSEAHKALNSLPVRNVVCWNALIAGYAEHGPGEEALRCLEKMQLDCISADPITFVHILKACGSIRDIDRGREIHLEIIQKGFERDVFLGNTLVYMYAKCGSLSEAQEVFDKLPVKDVVSWTALTAGYAEHGYGQEALKCLEHMQMAGISFNAVTFVCGLKACISIGAIDKGRELHTEITRKGFENDLFVGNALIDLYAKCGSLIEAQEVFDKLLVRDVISWNALIAGYAEHGFGQAALRFFEQMQLGGISPDTVTYIYGVKACSSLGAINMGRQLHAKITKKVFERDPLVGSTLIDMYAKCGSVSEAREVFDKMPLQNVVLWSTMINGYGMNHEGNLAVQCFEDMKKQNIKPNEITFTHLLTACSCSKLATEGQKYFELMREEYGILPTIDHYTCMVDLLARAGHLYEAEKFLKTMPLCPSIDTWTALLSACKTFAEVELGQRCFRHLVQMNPENAASYVLLGSTYASAGRTFDACDIEDLRKTVGARKKPANALIEVNMMVNEFVVGSNQSEEMSAMLEILNSRVKEEGHAPSLNAVLRPICDEKKEVALWEHAEKLAVAFGLLNTQRGQTLHVTKNMRMCNNCHDAHEIISRMETREIIVKDSYCTHHFKDGFCSCKTVL